jgi:hypothetical protein
MFHRRQQRLRVLEELERRVRAFRTDEDLYPLRVPREPVPLPEVITQALPDNPAAFDARTLRQRTLLRLEWEDGSVWELWVLVLPSGLKLFCDSGEEEARVLASGGRRASDETDRQFLQLLAESAGARFGIELSGGAPSRVRTPLGDREFLVDLFVELFEVAGAEDSVRRALVQARALTRSGHAEADRDFHHDVASWLDQALGPA